MPFAYSILDLSPIPEGGTAAIALRNSRDLAQHAEEWGYSRYWVAEHDRQCELGYGSIDWVYC